MEYWTGIHAVTQTEKTIIGTGYVGCALLSLLMVRAGLHYWKTSKSKKNFTIYGSILGSLSMISTMIGVVTDQIIPSLCGIALYSIFTFPSLTILIQMIGKRVGTDFDLVATGNIFVLGSLATLLILGGYQVLLFFFDNKLATIAMSGAIGILTVSNVFLIACGTSSFNTKFKRPKIVHNK